MYFISLSSKGWRPLFCCGVLSRQNELNSRDCVIFGHLLHNLAAYHCYRELKFSKVKCTGYHSTPDSLKAGNGFIWTGNQRRTALSFS